MTAGTHPKPTFLHRLIAPITGRWRTYGAERAKRRAGQCLRADLSARLDQFLATTQFLDLSPVSAPAVSVVIVLYNQAELTFGCLTALAQSTERRLEVILVDNASSDRTGALLSRIRGAKIIKNATNAHFLAGANQGAEAAQAAYLLFLNNDAFVDPTAVARALAILDADPSIGAVGAKIILPDSGLQEAGTILWNDGSALGYGRGHDPNSPPYQFQRVVDYCSGAFLMMRQVDFKRLSGFDPIYAPAYYEETDLCLRLQALGLSILYDPCIEIRHMEFGSATTRAEALSLQTRNRQIFLDRHRVALSKRAPPGTNPLFARDPRTRPRLLVIDDRVPFDDLGAGMPRAALLLRTLIAMDVAVTFFPRTNPRGDWAEIRRAFPPSLEVMLDQRDERIDETARRLADHLPKPIRRLGGMVYRLGQALVRQLGRAADIDVLAGDQRLLDFLTERRGFYQTIIVSRPHNMEAICHLLTRQPDLLGPTRLIYDAEALFAPREAMRHALAGRPWSTARLEDELARELNLTRPAQGVLAVNNQDADRFRRTGHTHVRVLGHGLDVNPGPTGFDHRHGFLFVGSLEADQSPNSDSLRWFQSEIAPLFDRYMDLDWQLDIIGRHPPHRPREITDKRLNLRGAIDDLVPVYDGARVFVAPTRFAAGVPHKIHEAAAHGVPVVATSILAEQLGWSHEVELLVADSADDFARCAARLYRDADLWQRLRASALARVQVDCSLDRFSEAVAWAIRGA